MSGYTITELAPFIFLSSVEVNGEDSGIGTYTALDRLDAYGKSKHWYVHPALVERPEMGFAVPLASWLRGSLRAWAESLLDESRLRREGYLDAEVVRRGWSEHLSGRRNWQQQLWNVLMFQAWLGQAA